MFIIDLFYNNLFIYNYYKYIELGNMFTVIFGEYRPLSKTVRLNVLKFTKLTCANKSFTKY